MGPCDAASTLKRERPLTYPFEKAATCDEERAIATSLPREDLVEAVLSHSWDSCVASTMGAISDRDDCPLLAVLFMFDLGDASYHSNPAVQGDQAMFDLFVRIQKRINAGAYSHRPEDHVANDSPSVANYLDTASNPIAPWALSAKIVEPALVRPPAGQRPLSQYEEQTALEIFEAMKEAAPQGEEATNRVAMRAVVAGRGVEKRVEELIETRSKKRKLLKKWPLVAIWGVGIWLVLPSLQRMVFN